MTDVGGECIESQDGYHVFTEESDECVYCGCPKNKDKKE